MLAGGILLTAAAAAFGEFRGFDPLKVSAGAWFALLYLIVAGSIIGFTAYLWLLHHESPTKVGTYAYVNPVVAVLIGYLMGGEALGLRTILGTLFVLISVVVITTTRAKKPAPASEAKVGVETGSHIQLAHVLRIQPERFDRVHVELLLLDEVVLQPFGSAQNRLVIHQASAHHRRVELPVRSFCHVLHMQQREALRRLA
jgi:uncharacterized membrane protein